MMEKCRLIFRARENHSHDSIVAFMTAYTISLWVEGGGDSWSKGGVGGGRMLTVCVLIEQ